MINKIKTNVISESWNAFWKGIDTAAFSGNGVNHPSLQSFWNDFFSENNNVYPVNVIDIASGNGALYAIAKEITLVNFHCIDISTNAIQAISKKFPEVHTLLADVSSIPLPNDFGDIVISQFGIEYANDNAINEACRLTKPNGKIAFMMHIDDGAIYIESLANLSIITEIKKINIFQIAEKFFRNIYNSLYKNSQACIDSKDFATSMKQIESLLSQYGTESAAGLTYKIYNDIADVFENIKNYDINEVTEWLANLSVELDAYEYRMQSMLNSAKSSSEIDKLTKQLKSFSMNITISDKLYSLDSDIPLCWIIVANKDKGA